MYININLVLKALEKKQNNLVIFNQSFIDNYVIILCNNIIAHISKVTKPREFIQKLVKLQFLCLIKYT